MYHLVVYWPIYAKKLISIVDPLKVPFRLTGHICFVKEHSDSKSKYSEDDNMKNA